MIYCRFAHQGRNYTGMVEDGAVHQIHGSIFDTDPRRGSSFLLADIEFLPPVVPPTFYAAGFNYAAHLKDHEELGYTPVRLAEYPEAGYRANSALVGHGAQIVKPAGVEGRFEAEGELVAVIGQDIKHATYEQAKAAVFGWTIGNDVSAREWQHADRTFWRSKNSDTFKPMGPWIVTDINPLESTTTVSLNGTPDATFATGAMIFDPYEFIVEITKYITMRQGDVLWMGAQGASGIAVGDTVDITISGIGTLSNRVVGDDRALVESSLSHEQSA